MPTPYPDPFSGLAQGLQQGFQMGLLRRQQAQAEQAALEKKAQEEYQKAYQQAQLGIQIWGNEKLPKTARISGGNDYVRFRNKYVAPDSPLDEFDDVPDFAKELSGRLMEIEKLNVPPAQKAQMATDLELEYGDQYKAYLGNKVKFYQDEAKQQDSFRQGEIQAQALGISPDDPNYPRMIEGDSATRKVIGEKYAPEGDKDQNEFQTFKSSYLEQYPNASGIDVVKAYKEQSASIDRPATRAQTAAIGHSLRGELRQNPYIKDYQTMDSKFTAMEKALEASKKSNNFVAIDQALITLYNKILDPSSVVRESEYARTPENLSLWSRFKGKVDKYGAGGAGITQEDRQALVDMALQIRDSYEQSYNETIDDYSALAKEVGVSEKLIGIPFRKGNKGAKNPSPNLTIDALPAGAKLIGTSGGKKVYQTPDGKKFMED